jgi:hypothetical protein
MVIALYPQTVFTALLHQAQERIRVCAEQDQCDQSAVATVQKHALRLSTAEPVTQVLKHSEL